MKKEKIEKIEKAFVRLIEEQTQGRIDWESAHAEADALLMECAPIKIRKLFSKVGKWYS